MIQTVVKKSLYESDYLLWIQETVAQLKTRDFDNIDFENLIEEIEDLGRSPGVTHLNEARVSQDFK